MSSITGAQPHVAAGLLRTPEFTFPARLRTSVAATVALVGRSFAAGRTYDGAHGPSARRAVLREFAGTR
ncbi:hypothetical protein [Blastococcus capsensis]|uniref:hypothetical protein n=1 Tax=Blastococcus capsensis TaxID=1564163 RepID=UPI0025400C7A|nr:hypothetical protein [Blastococcus capsensis]MDK3255396.1 hypothetical protein [Blastococcus capsensis]